MNTRSLRLLLPLACLATGLTIGLTIGLLGTAAAGTNFAVTISSKAGAADACAQSATAVAEAKQDNLTVTVDAKQKADLNLTVESVGSVVSIKAGATEAKFPAAAYANNKLLVMSAGKKVCELLLAPPVTPTTPKPGDPAPTTPTTPPVEVDKAALAALEQGARAFLDSKNITDHQVSGGTFGRTYRIYHLPTGAPAFPLPRHINEKDDVEIWTVLPEDATLSVEVSACDKVPAVRVGGTYKAAKELVGSLQAATTFKLDVYSKRLNCAGTLTYKLDVSHKGLAASTTTSIAFDPVYRFEWGVGFMFDFGRPQKLSLGDRPTDDGMGNLSSEKFIIESDDYSGFKPVIALGVNVCRTNPSEMTWCDRLVNPTILLDPTRLTSGFGFGLNFRPFHGLGLFAGMSLYKTTTFADGTMASVGDPWTIAGDVPTKEVFNKDSFGFVLSAIISTDVFKELTKSE